MFLHLSVILFVDRGACVVAPGGCMVAAGGCAWLLPGGHVWLLMGGVWLLGGMYGCSWGGMHGMHTPWDMASHCVGGMHPTGMHSCLGIKVAFYLFCGNKSSVKCTAKNPIFRHLAFGHFNSKFLDNPDTDSYISRQYAQEISDTWDCEIHMKNYVKLVNIPNNLTDFTPQKHALKCSFAAILFLNQL